ncbi:CPBP family intramembrane metalloprotease [Virgibacillus sp. NKC19-16]|uniref:CPBP family intramembrane glutamic endopeptidase n=1 Tax=Virgibacillus salidurans TaxID=2831673 RepID=UPI001F34F52D|nr:CPBP family intramembrane glutamic endopeptidase [Virgibacillus sp. NKC19-16]UJL48116.1 CPBP family intramembrane metalloprotease [Virgibacillus sp. NKC19-16]
MKQSEIIKMISDEELKKQLLLSQFIFLFIGFILSIFLFDNLSEWLIYIEWDVHEIVYYGVIPGLIIVFIDILLMVVFPKRYYDDGGINERIFKNQSIAYIFILSLVVAVSEEILFRGVIQTTFGYVFTSVLFALIHFRYLKKPVLLISVLFVSFYIGYMFEITGNLLVTITAHFTVDFLLGLLIRFQKWGAL